MKKELIEKIGKNLQSAGVTVTTDHMLRNDEVIIPLDCSELQQLRWLPIANLEKIADYPIKKVGEKFSKVWELWGREGFLKFTPYIMDDNYPSLVLRTNRFLHMFRGYHFQVSYTHDGRGDYESGIQRLDPLFRLYRNYHYDDLIKDSKYVALLWYSHVITVGSVIDSFRDCLSDYVLLTDFLMQTLSQDGIELDYSWGDMQEYIFYEVGNIDYTHYQKVYEYGSKQLLFRLAFDDKKVQVEYMRNGKPHVITVTIPGIFDGVNTNSYFEEYLEECEDAILSVGDKYLGNIGTFTLLALSLAGFHANYMAMYSLCEHAPLRPTSACNIVQIEKLEEIEFIEKETE